MDERLKSILKQEKLEHLLPIFTDQGVTDSILSDFSADDLRELGIEKLGERKRLLAAFACEMASAVSNNPASSEPPTAPQEDFTYEASHGAITITGFRGKGHIRIPQTFDELPVRAIASKAFSDNAFLLSVTFPEGVTDLSRDAFFNCTSLESVTIPDSETKFNIPVFEGCPRLATINASDSHVKYSTLRGAIYDKHFSKILKCPARVNEFIIPESVTHIGDYAFFGCVNLNSLTIPDSVTSIGHRAFYGCTNLISVRIPEEVQNIESEAFRDCINLNGVTIPDRVTIIPKRAFYNCSNLASVTIPDSVTSIGSCAFYDCINLRKVTIPESVKIIEWGAFESCPGGQSAHAEWQKRCDEALKPKDEALKPKDRPSFMRWFS